MRRALKVENEPEVVTRLGKRKFRVYPAVGLFASSFLGTIVRWDGDDVDEFLDFAEAAEADTMYLRRVRLDASEFEPDPDLERHDGETGLVEIAYLKNGLLHVFTWEADWADELFDVAEEETGEENGLRRIGPPGSPPEGATAELTKAGEALTSRGRDLIDGFLDRVRTRDEPPPDPDRDWDVRHDFLSYLGTELDLPGLGSRFSLLSMETEASDPQAERALKSSVAEVVKRLRVREREVVAGAAAEFESWTTGRDIPLRSLNLERAREFADERGLKLSPSGLRELRDRAAATIKRRRPGGSHH